MTQVISLVTPAQAMTPAHSSPMGSDDYGRPRAFRALPDTPESPSPRTSVLGRKRAASINTADAHYGRLERLQLSTPTSMASSEGTRDICLCTPAPKIPRPRNAFILYRQHHQAQVVARNPNLSNPDISKIIGEQWQDEPKEVKDNWKSLADEEKQRHQRQYPDYRYQPRRGNKGQGLRSGSLSGDDSGRCPKCNLRLIATPQTPSTPFPTPASAEDRPVPYPYTPSLRGEEAEAARRGSYGNLPVMRQRLPMQRPAYREVDDYEPDTPEIKRRRFNSIGGYRTIPSPGARAMSIGGAAQRPYPVTPHPDPHFTRSKAGPMPPPPRPGAGGPWPDHENRGRYPHESLRLPPLQTSGPMSPNTVPEVDIQQLRTPVTGLGISNPRDPQARSVEAMVMSMPFTEKLALIARITRTENDATESSSKGAGKRGAVIAIEGPKPRMLKQVGALVERALLSSNEVALKTWGKDTDGDPNSQQQGSRSEDESPSPSRQISSCFETMVHWHQNSREMMKHITSQAEPLLTSKMEIDPESPISRRGSIEEDNASKGSGDDAVKTKTPVALVKEGFSLTRSEEFACTVPIADSYAPIDHWQWMATLWRGIVATDLVVYVKPSLDEEIATYGSVEVLDGLIIIRIAVGKSLDEATERRVAFEVVEWVRGGSFRERR
ncbi:slightly ste11-like protein [Fusarium equiseti]|uniref:Slightly ste11-like protein n=1 Tax=Fusarium equiseti TaxID=61235 RepID=A0ABQ8RIF1_FUSEQ|nr:slightly ste11-like protein [Fusarium equiseti]